MTWGPGGAGGAGTWDTETINWFDGAQNVTWPSSGDAIFAGASSGRVTVDSSTAAPVVSSMTFDRGFVIEGGTILGGQNGLTITANQSSTINSNLSGPGSVLVKNGPSTLELGSAPSFDAVHVDRGRLRVTGPLATFPEVKLADVPGATLTLATSGPGIFLDGLAGGGPAGGVVSGSLTVGVSGDGEFGGRLQGGLAPLFSGAFRLTGANTHTRATSIFGELGFAGSGSALNSPMSISGTLLLDNRDTVLGNRVSDTLRATMDGGSIRLEGNASAPVEEMLGELALSRASRITVHQPDTPAAQLTFAGVQRNGQATLDVVGPGVRIEGLVSGSTGIVAPYVTAGGEWATLGPDDRIAPLSTYAADINSGSTTDHVKLSGEGTTVLAGDTTRASLNLQNGAGLQSAATADQVLDLAGHNLELTSGGVLSSGASPGAIVGGSLSTPAHEMVVTAHNDLAISSAIVDGGGPTMLTKSGPGTVTLSGTNTHTGPTAIVQGTLVVAADANLGAGSTILLSGGRLEAAADFSSTKGFASLPLGSGGSGDFDTGGFNVEFSGASTGVLRKTGAGRLTLTGPLPDVIDVRQGALELPNAASSSVRLWDGTLQATGTLSDLIVFPLEEISVLDIGGPAAATLTTDFFVGGFSVDGKMQVNFGLGSQAADFWEISIAQLSAPVSGEEAIQFAFHNLGGVSPGVDYPLMSFANPFFDPSPELFAIAPESMAAGWSGEFTANRDGVSIRFTAVPEPSLTVLLLLQGVVLALGAGRLLKRPKRREAKG